MAFNNTLESYNVPAIRAEGAATTKLLRATERRLDILARKVSDLKTDQLLMQDATKRSTQLETQMQTVNRTGGTGSSISGTKKLGELTSKDHTVYKNFKESFPLHTKTHKWSPADAKRQLMMSLQGDAYIALSKAVANWESPTISVDDIFKSWNRIILLESLKIHAIQQYTKLAQNADESYDAYLVRAMELHRLQQTSEVPVGHKHDKQFIYRVIAVIRNVGIARILTSESPDTSPNCVILSTARLPCSPVKHPAVRTATKSLNQAA